MRDDHMGMLSIPQYLLTCLNHHRIPSDLIPPCPKLHARRAGTKRAFRMPGRWSHDTCVGQLTMFLHGSQQHKWVVRNRGGGTSVCCANHPVAAPARIEPTDRSVQLKLEQRADNEGSRNGARVYFADECVEGHYHPDRYTALQLLGNTFSVTIDLSSASCSCNVAWYLVPMRSNSDPGTCDGDFYCDANKVGLARPLS